MAWFGTRTYVGASWTVARQAGPSLTWNEITATNPFPDTVALALLFRGASGAFDPRFFATHGPRSGADERSRSRHDHSQLLDGVAHARSSPTPIVPSAL